MANALPLEPGDNVLMIEGDHPNNAYAWLNLRRKGVEVRFIQLETDWADADTFAPHIDNRTRTISLSHVTSHAGHRHDVAAMGALCRDRSIYLVVDAMQSLGVMPADVGTLGVSLLAAGCHKGLLVPQGLGVLYAKQPIEDLQPAYLAIGSLAKPPDDYIARPDRLAAHSSARRFEIGNYNLPHIHALGASLDFLSGIGVDNISNHVLDLGDQLIDHLDRLGIALIGPRERERRSHIYVLALPGEGWVDIDDLRTKTHRGLSGQVQRGFHAGGLSYGYKSVGDEAGHTLIVDQEAAEWVRWIFRHYADGWSCQRIAAELNRLNVRSPRNGTWAVSALYGAPKKGSGILNNDFYRGRYVWNRSQWLKDPDTGKRQRTDRPASEWQTVERPELRIVDKEDWTAVQARIRAPRRLGGAVGPGPRPKTLLSGLLRCGLCGGAVVAVDSIHYGCAARKDRGPSVCQGLRASRKGVESRVLSVVRDEILSPDRLTRMHQRARRSLGEQDKDRLADEQRSGARMAALDARISRLVDAIAEMGMSQALRQKLAEAENERAEIVARQERRGRRSTVPPSDLVARYRRTVTGLRSALAPDPSRSRTILHELLGETRLEAAGDEIYAEFEARPERIFLSGRGASNSGCGDRI